MIGRLCRVQGTLYNVTLRGRSLVAVAGSKSRVVSPDDVITVDGFQRFVITINGMFPGPTVEVLEGAEVRQIDILIYRFSHLERRS